MLGSTSSTIAPAIPLSPEPVSPSASTSAAAVLRQQRRALEREIQAQLDDEEFAGTLEERKKEVRRRRKLAMEPSPLQQGPSIFQLQKDALMRRTYTRFVHATRDPHALPGAIGAQRVADVHRSRQLSGHISLPTSPAPY